MAGPAVEPAPEPARTDRPVLPEGLVFADVYTRFAAYFLDGVLIGALMLDPPAVLGLYDYASTYPPEPMPRATFAGTTVFGLAVQAAYFLWFWTGGRRATPGQRVFGLQVGNAFDGQPLTMTQAVTRWVAMGWWLTQRLLLLPFFVVAIGAYAASVICGSSSRSRWPSARPSRACTIGSRDRRSCDPPARQIAGRSVAPGSSSAWWSWS